MASYFERLTAIPEIGREGLRALQSADIAIVGTGGVGSAAAWSLAALGIGRLRLLDQDIVEVSNLHRLSGIDQNDLHAPKAEALARRIKSRYPWTNATPTVETVRNENCSSLLGEAELILDGTDNFQTRYALNRFSIKNKVPYLFTSAIANQGHISLFSPPQTPCLECMLPGQETDPMQSCETLGVSPTTVGIIGALAASEAAKSILGLPSKIKGQLLTLDLGELDLITAKISKRPMCRACSNSSHDDGETTKVVMLCGGGVANVLPDEDKLLNLPFVQNKIPDKNVIAISDSVLVYNRESYRVSIFKTGRLLISKVDTEETASRIAREIWSEIA